MAKSVFDLDLSVRAFNYLKHNGIETVEQFKNHVLPSTGITLNLWSELVDMQDNLKPKNYSICTNCGQRKYTSECACEC